MTTVKVKSPKVAESRDSNSLTLSNSFDVLSDTLELEVVYCVPNGVVYSTLYPNLSRVIITNPCKNTTTAMTKKQVPKNFSPKKNPQAPMLTLQSNSLTLARTLSLTL